MKKLNQMMALFVAAMLTVGTASAGQEQQTTKSEPTQSQLALDHGPRAQVTPAVKRERLEQKTVQSH